ncbi:MAG: DNA methyltransferase [Chloroflexota bacterium]
MKKQRLHTYAASFGGDLARKLLKEFSFHASAVLDPFMGSGTSLVEALSAGSYATGIDVDPIACLISKTLTRQYSLVWLSEFYETTIMELKKLENELEALDINTCDFTHGSSFDLYDKSIQIPNVPQIDYWFSKTQRIVLAVLVFHLHTLTDNRAYDIFALSISSSIIRKWPNTLSSAMDIDHSRPHKVPPIRTTIEQQLGLFLRVFSTTIKVLKELVPISACWLAEGKVIQGSSEKILGTLENESIDLILTSPPYVNAIDYPRAHKFSQWWLYNGDQSWERENYIGLRGTRGKNDLYLQDAHELAPKSLKKINWSKEEINKAGLVHRYICDMNKIIEGCYQVLKRDGELVFVLADNQIGNKIIPVTEIVAELLTSKGFKSPKISYREIDHHRRRYPFNFKGIMKHEAIIVASK